MSRARTLVTALSLVCFLLVPRPVQAQDISLGSIDMSGAVALGVAGVVYVVGGTATFIALDVSHMPPKKPLPTGIGVAQVVFGSTLMAVGVVGFAAEDHALGATFLGLGAGLAAVPIVDWSVRGARGKKETSLRLNLTSVQLSGTF